MTNEHTCGGCGSEMSRSEIQAMAFVRVADEWIAATDHITRHLAPDHPSNAAVLKALDLCRHLITAHREEALAHAGPPS